MTKLNDLLKSEAEGFDYWMHQNYGKLEPDAYEKLQQSYQHIIEAVIQETLELVESKMKPISKVQSILAKKGIDRKGTVKELKPMYSYNQALDELREALQAKKDEV